MTAETVLVTGANGLIGNALIKRLHGAGRAVVAMDRVAPEGLDHAIPVVLADIGDGARLDQTMERYEIGAIAHCGAISGPMVANDQPDLVYRINVLGTMNVVAAAWRRRVRRLVFISSIAAYGNQPMDRPVSEDAPLDATDPYGASKAACEALLRGYRRGGLDVVALRVSGVYGPRRTTACAIREMIEHAQAGRPLRLEFGRGWRRQYVHIDDVVAALMRALDAGTLPRMAYNVTGGTWVALDEIAALVKRAVSSADIEIAAEGHPFDNRIGRLDIAAAARDLGYVPAVALADGIARYAQWLAARGKG
ncbi:MAG: NAD(P)-dependent oxidoreductase [Alphaproteobacteria bacterium]|nr:NAD(P)-dependent oxidoreductase [Alphaproteobacteria bacterium]